MIFSHPEVVRSLASDRDAGVTAKENKGIV
jgi:hypothetical protein